MKFAQICSKHALKYTIFVNIQKRPKMAKWPNHFISGKQFQKRPNKADLAFKKAKWQPCFLSLSFFIFFPNFPSLSVWHLIRPLNASRSDSLSKRCLFNSITGSPRDSNTFDVMGNKQLLLRQEPASEVIASSFCSSEF